MYLHNNILVPDNAIAGTGGWTPPDIIAEIGADSALELLAELIDTFRLDTAARLRGLRQAISASDLEKVRVTSHTVKGSARQMGAQAMAMVCQEIEMAADTCPTSSIELMAARLDQSFADVCRDMAAYTSHVAAAQ